MAAHEDKRLNQKIVGEAEQVKEYKDAMKEHPEAAKRDTLADDEPFVLESSATDPEFPAMQEFEVDADGPSASRRPKRTSRSSPRTWARSDPFLKMQIQSSLFSRERLRSLQDHARST